ncbi:MAG: RNA polymerase sigma-54 factor, partial [Desulfobulbaceae bacterium]|nr:RNA polymerase sigma-54 factor [Desulfobulbaceae bacterium]
MGFEFKQQLQLKLAQQLVMTPQLQQAIKLLQLSMLELTQTVEQELEENPVLEVAGTDGESEEETHPEDALNAEQTEMGTEVAKAVDVDLEGGSSISEIDWNDYANEYETAPAAVPKENVSSVSGGGPDQRTKKPNLQAHLQWQLSLSDVTDEEEKVGQYIIGNLNIDGFLEVDEENIIDETGCDPHTARKMIAKIRHMDPPGIGAVTVQDSLALQLDRLNLGDSLASVIVKKYLNRLETKNYAAIAKATHQPVDAVLAAVKIIMGLSPYPGRPYNDEEPHYILPDVYVYKVDDEYVIMLNDDGLPQLRVNQFYRDILRNKTKTPEATREYVKSKMKSAIWLIKSIQ